jgi:RNA polymerase sigma-70 factor (ECF subfamily)
MAVEVFQIIQDLYRKEFSKMVAVFSSFFGLTNIELAEDVVSDSFMEAAERWKCDGIPPNPSAWLYTVARNKALHHFRRKKIHERKINDLQKEVSTVETNLPELDFSATNVFDSQLKMLFAVCNPAIVSEAQITLALRILCGFTIDEIAAAFFTSKETINKRLYRAKEKLRDLELQLEMPMAEEVVRRLETVLHIIYLLFNEGYYASNSDAVLRKHLCGEALSLALMLCEQEGTNTAKTNALVALMCFHSSRIEARLSDANEYILYDDQDSTQWDEHLIAKGVEYLEKSATGTELSSYHLEAGIAFYNSLPGDSKDKWQQILHHYNLLLKVNYTPATLLNRIYALYKAEGSAAALRELVEVPSMESHFYYTLLGKLNEDLHPEISILSYKKALQLAKTESERQIINYKIEAIQEVLWQQPAKGQP